MILLFLPFCDIIRIKVPSGFCVVLYLAVKAKCIDNIDSLTMLVNLRHLELLADNIKDIRPLRNLKRVQYLKVSRNFWTSLQIKRIAKELGLVVAKYPDYYLLTERSYF